MFAKINVLKVIDSKLNYLPYFHDYSNFFNTNNLYSPSEKNLSFFSFGPILRPKTLRFWGSECFPIFQFLGVVFLT